MPTGRKAETYLSEKSEKIKTQGVSGGSKMVRKLPGICKIG